MTEDTAAQRKIQQMQKQLEELTVRAANLQEENARLRQRLLQIEHGSGPGTFRPIG